MRRSAFDRLAEEQLYQLVVDEIRRDEKREGLWAKALVEAEGDKEKTQALYIKFRVQSLKDELEYAEYAQQEEAKREAEFKAEEKNKRETERKDQKRRTNLAEAELKRLGIKFKKSQAGWIVTLQGKEISFSAIDDLEKLITEYIQDQEKNKSRDTYLVITKHKLRDRQYRVYRTAKNKQEWCLEKINGSYNDRKIFDDFEQLKATIDQIIATTPGRRPRSGCQTLILLPAIGLLILTFIVILS